MNRQQLQCRSLVDVSRYILQSWNKLTWPYESRDLIKRHSKIGAFPETIAASRPKINDAIEIRIYCEALQDIRQKCAEKSLLILLHQLHVQACCLQP